MPTLFLLLLILCSTPIFADEPEVMVKSPAATSKAVDNATDWETRHKDKPYIALVNEYDVHLNNDWTYDETYHARVKVQQDSALDLGEWPVYYNKSREQVLDIKAYTETPDGKKTQATDIADNEVYQGADSFSELRVKIIKLPTVAVGNVIDVTIKTKTLTKEMSNSFWHSVSLPVIPTKYARYLYSFPTSYPVKFNAYNNKLEPVVVEKNGQTVYTFVLQNTDYQVDEDYMLPLDEITGVLSFSSIADWKDVANWYRDQISKATVDDADLSAKTLELIKDKTNATDKALAIVEFIQDNFKYVAISPGDHGVMLHPTNTIFANKYGDTKDLTLIARQMMAIAGIHANICLFSGEFNGNPQHSLPNPNVFDHLILQADIDGKKIFIDPQAKGFNFGQLPASYDNAHVLVVEDQAFHFEELPISTEDFNSIESISEITIEPDGSALFEVKVSLPFEASQNFKQQWAGSDQAQQEKFFEQLQSNFTPGGKMLDRQVTGVNDRYARVVFNLKYQSPDAYPIVNDMILLKEADQSNMPEIPDTKRKSPIFFPTNSLIHNINIYHIPDGYAVDALPDAYDLTSDFMQVKAKYIKADQKVSVDVAYHTKRVTLTANRYDEVKKYRLELDRKSDKYLVLKRKSNVAPQAKDWIKKQ